MGADPAGVPVALWGRAFCTVLQHKGALALTREKWATSASSEDSEEICGVEVFGSIHSISAIPCVRISCFSNQDPDFGIRDLPYLGT